MHKNKIADLLETNFQNLINWLEAQDDEKWIQGPQGKWTTGQQSMHLLQTIKPLNDALSMPKFLLRYTFGKTNRELYNYDALVKHYLECLQDTNVKTFKGSLNMKPSKIEDKRYILTRLQVEGKKLQYKTRKISDENLDTLVLPHPQMGKMPIRELLMWSAYHVEHHYLTLKQKY